MVESTLSGETIGEPLDVSVATQPEGIYFVPSTGEMIVVSEPNEMHFFKPQVEMDTPTDAPVMSPPADGVPTGSTVDSDPDDDSSAVTHSCCLTMSVLFLVSCFFM